MVSVQDIHTRDEIRQLKFDLDGTLLTGYNIIAVYTCILVKLVT